MASSSWPPQELCGTWYKDDSASDSTKPFMDIMALNGIIRQAVRLVRGIKIEQNDTTWTMAVFSFTTLLKVACERYPLDGSAVQFKRRDLRRGKHTGKLLSAERGPHGGLVLSSEWEQPLSGSATDEFVLAPRGTAAQELYAAQLASSPDAAKLPPPPVAPAADTQELHVWNSITVEDKTVTGRIVYTRK